MSLRIVVCVKYVPDATGDRRFADDLTLDREITVVTVGPEDARDALRKALSMGADKAVHVEDDDLHGSDVMGTSLVLAKAVEKTGYDLVICGMASTDGVMGVLPALLAERLGVPQVTLLSEVAVDGGVVTGRRDGDTASEQLEASLPAVVSVTDQSGEARYPSFKGIMAAKKKPVESLDLDDLGLDADEVGLAGAWTAVDSATERPARTAGTIVKDEGEGGKQLAGFLAGQKFI
ncbi:electron transfer flavoprotein subunit beta/FixA family protein [Streptomyces sp. wa1063]|uniref:electron transfer flavoprotein subunit beta/FixA family protein n=1 Tax=Streptomyces sp. wa1063 TaxID=1828212 RepID=UPI000BEF50A7|nr:electron transfer flavoprotein subunit beta/FixA family protein [Streptomyces sp. wa1063]